MTTPPQRDTELVRNLVSLWTSQNSLVWGRLSRITAMETAILAGWFALFKDGTYGQSAMCVVLGVVLATVTGYLIECDLKWKYDIGKRLRTADDRILPNVEDVKDVVAGHVLMRGIVWGF